MHRKLKDRKIIYHLFTIFSCYECMTSYMYQLKLDCKSMKDTIVKSAKLRTDQRYIMRTLKKKNDVMHVFD